MGDDVIDYSRPGPLTLVDPLSLGDGTVLGSDPASICAVVRDLVIEPSDAVVAGVPEVRLAERSIRPAGDIIAALRALSPEPLHLPREALRRVVGTCRHYAVLGCAFLRLQGVPARARCGFSTYFVPGKSVDHWVVEYWHEVDLRWVRVDTELLGAGVVPDPADLGADEFLTGGEAWSRYRAGLVDPDTFGVAGVDYAWGIGEIRGNAIRDLASLCKVEMLPWDEWGRMDDSYHGRTGPDYDELMDVVANACRTDDPQLLSETYRSHDLAVPQSMII
jgi:hypothetical protein